MSRTYTFESEHAFVHKLEELLEDGVAREDISTVTPFPVLHAFEVMKEAPERKSAKVKWFTLLGAVTGLCTGFGLTIYSVLHWPMITGGKPIVSIPAFVVIAYELTILLGGIFSFLGFLLLSRIPSVKNILCPEETGNRFVIEVREDEEEER